LNRKLLYLLAGLGGAGAVVLLARRVLAKPYPLPYPQPEWIPVCESQEIEPVVVCDVQIQTLPVTSLEFDYYNPGGDNIICYEMYRDGALMAGGSFFLPQNSSWGHHVHSISETGIEVNRVKVWTTLPRWPLSLRNIEVGVYQMANLTLWAGEQEFYPKVYGPFSFAESTVDRVEFDYEAEGWARVEIGLFYKGKTVRDFVCDLEPAPSGHKSIEFSPVLADSLAFIVGFLGTRMVVKNLTLHRLV